MNDATFLVGRSGRTESGKKAIAVDEKYMRLAEEALYSELAFALGVEKDKVLKIILSNH